MEILIDVLPIAPRRNVRLVHDAEVRIPLEVFVPPVPAGSVAGCVSKGLEVGHGLPVGDCKEGIAGPVINGNEGGGFAEVWRLRGLGNASWFMGMWLKGTYTLSRHGRLRRPSICFGRSLPFP